MIFAMPSPLVILVVVGLFSACLPLIPFCNRLTLQGMRILWYSFRLKFHVLKSCSIFIHKLLRYVMCNADQAICVSFAWYGVVGTCMRCLYQYCPSQSNFVAIGCRLSAWAKLCDSERNPLRSVLATGSNERWQLHW